MNTHSRTVARRYARALLEVARAESRERACALRGELEGFVRLLQSSPQLQSALAHPALKPEARRRLLGALADAAAASPLLKKLLALLAARERDQLLPELAASYAELLNAALGIVSAKAVSAVPLAEPQRAALAAALAGALGKKVELEMGIEPALIGGLRVQVAGRTYDGSVQAQLQALRRQLAAGR